MSFRAEQADFSSAFAPANASACAVEVLCRIECILLDESLFIPLAALGNGDLRGGAALRRWAGGSFGRGFRAVPTWGCLREPQRGGPLHRCLGEGGT